MPDIKKILQFVESNKNSAFFYTPNIYGGRSYFFTQVNTVITASNYDELDQLFSEVDKRRTKNEIGFGLIPYETGYYFEERLQKYTVENYEPVRFYFSEKESVQIINTKDLNYSGIRDLIVNQKNKVEEFKLNSTKREFLDKIEKIKNYIREGNTYQVNFTLKADFNYSGSIAALFALLIFNQSAKYSCIINLGDKYILSISPELFFKVNGDIIEVRPMKGTIPRGKNIAEDLENRNKLALSSKDKAENVMIVDLLRNDLGRIANFNTVKPEKIFEIEKYESVYQMVSSVKAKLNRKSFADIIKNLFPCGSITGAPKIRTMQIIHELEKNKRGIYTGAIGLFGKDFMKFNVPIRTLEISSSGKGQVGLGSGIVWDSDPLAEYNETLTKGKFIYAATAYFELIETMRYSEGEIFLLDKHLKRLKNAAEFFLFVYDEKKIRHKLNELINKLSGQLAYKIRLALNKWGDINLNHEEIKQINKEARIIISEKKIDSSDKFVYFKTTNRKLYNEEYLKYSKLGYTDVLFFNERNELTEGAITNVFIKNNGSWYTPQLSCGLLNGTYREYFMEKNNCQERILYANDLFSAEEVVIANSVSGAMKVVEILH